jgi:hypothetical protein
MQMNLSSSKIQSLKTCNKNRKTSMLFAGSRSPLSSPVSYARSRPICCETLPKTYYSVTERLFSYFCTGRAREVRSIRLRARLVSDHLHCILIFTRGGKRFTGCLSTDTSNHNGNHHCAHPSNIQSMGRFLMQRCSSDDDQPVLFKKEKVSPPRSIRSFVSNLQW